MKITDKVLARELDALLTVATSFTDTGKGDTVVDHNFGIRWVQIASMVSELKSARMALDFMQQADTNAAALHKVPADIRVGLIYGRGDKSLSEQEADAVQERKDLETDILGALEDHCTSFCLDEPSERGLTTHHVANRLIRQGWHR